MSKGEVKNKVKEQYEGLDEMIGNPIGEIKPVPLKHFSEFMSNIAIINSEALWTNFLQDETAEAVNKVLTMSIDKDKETVMSTVNAKNYPEIMKHILGVNGIKLDDGESDEVDKKKE